MKAKLAGGLKWSNERMLALRASMTPGQRWTAAMALVLTIAVLSFGLPDRLVVVPGPSAAASAGRADTGTRTPATADTTSLFTAPAASTRVLGPPAAAAVIPAPGAGASPAAADGAMLTSGRRVVALARPGNYVPGRSDADIARVFLAALSQPVEVLVAEPADASVCERVAAVADVVLTSEGLDPGLRDCLLAARRTVVGFDQAGTGETLLSTRRGVGDALADLAPLRGKVGVVASARIKPTVERALSKLGAIDAVYLDDGSAGTAQIPDGVRRFASKGIDVVVFALPVDQQKRWAGLQAVLAPNVSYAVADAFDAFADETYPARFDGSTAITSQRSSWFARDHGETQQQAGCRTQWEHVAKPSRVLDDAEKLRVYSWCQNAALLAQALMAEGPVAFAIAQTRLVSPLTSDLAPLATGSFGPTLLARLVWRAACSCWKESTPFASPTYASRP